MAMTPELEVTMMPTGGLVPYVGNAKRHPEWQVEQIAASIEAFGFNDPIAVWHDVAGHPVIVEGHGRLLAAKRLGMEEVPVVTLDHLDDEGRRAYTLAHNQTNLTTGFDLQTLDAELDAIEGFDMSEFGFEVSDLMAPQEVGEAPVPEVVECRCKPGDVWQLGMHRVMCGDSTDPEAVEKLMGGARADICLTSPPYNMGRGRGKDDGAWETVPNIAMKAGHAYNEFKDDLTDEAYADLLNRSLDNALSHCDDVMYNIGVLGGSRHGIASMLWDHVAQFSEIVVWNKDRSMPLGMRSQAGMLSHRCEPIFCFNGRGTRSFSHPQWERGHGINRIDTDSAAGNEYGREHAATFPVEFAAEVLRLYTEGSVLDLFGGTGTTLVAAEQLGRTCYMMELDPHYCDLIIARWEELTGGTAELESER